MTSEMTLKIKMQVFQNILLAKLQLQLKIQVEVGIAQIVEIAQDRKRKRRSLQCSAPSLADSQK